MCVSTSNSTEKPYAGTMGCLFAALRTPALAICSVCCNETSDFDVPRSTCTSRTLKCSSSRSLVAALRKSSKYISKIVPPLSALETKHSGHELA